MIEEILNEFRKLGYVIQEPSKDKTYYFVNQLDTGTKQIYIKLMKNSAKVSYRKNFKDVDPSAFSELECNLVEDLIFEGYQLKHYVLV